MNCSDAGEGGKFPGSARAGARGRVWSSRERRGWRKRGKGSRLLLLLLLLLLLEDVHLPLPERRRRVVPARVPFRQRAPAPGRRERPEEVQPPLAYDVSHRAHHAFVAEAPRVLRRPQRGAAPLRRALRVRVARARDAGEDEHAAVDRPVLARVEVRNPRAWVDSRGCPSRAGDGAARAIAAARSGTIIARDGRMDVGAAGTSRAGR